MDVMVLVMMAEGPATGVVVAVAVPEVDSTVVQDVISKLLGLQLNVQEANLK